MKKNDEKDLMDKFADKMKRVDETLIKKIMEKENITRKEAEKKLKELNI